MSGINKEAAKPVRKVLDHLLALECPSCGTVGQYQLQDAIKEKRTWKIETKGVSKIEEADQEDAEPYFVACRSCGSELLLEDDDLQTLIDDKDTL